jgi:stage III sporulation protein AB
MGMLRLLGTVLVIGACSALGFSARQHMAHRVIILEQFIQMLDMISAELDNHQTPLPDIIHQLAEESGTELRRLFSEMNRRLACKDGLSFAYRWQTTIRDMAPELGLESEEITILRDVAAYLGRYQAEQQIFGLQQTRARLESVKANALHTLQTKGSVYRTCGIAGGIVAVLMML